MLDREALKQLQDWIIAANGLSDLDAVALPDGYTIHDLEQYNDEPRRHAREFNTDSIDDFIAYVNDTHHDADGPTIVFVGEPHVLAIIGASTCREPRFEKNTARLELARTPVYHAVMQLCEQYRLNQTELADWLTEWADFIGHGISLEGGKVPVDKTIAVIRRMKISGNSGSVHVSEVYGGSKSAMESVEINADEIKIIGIAFIQPLYNGMPAVEFTVRLSVFLDKEHGLEFSARILRHNDVILKQRAKIQAVVENRMDNDIDVYVGWCHEPDSATN